MRWLAVVAVMFASATAADAPRAQAPLLWGDAVTPGEPNPPPEVWRSPELVSKATNSGTPTHLRWAVLRCHLQGSPEHPRSIAQIRRLFEKPDVGVFAFYDRQSRGLLTQEIAWAVDVQLPRTWADYWSNATYTGAFLDATTRDCLQRSGRDLSDVTGVAVFFNDNIDCCAWGSKYQMDDGEGVRQVAGMWVPANMSHVASIVAHELAHALDVRHSNNTDRDWDTTDNAWDLMSSHYRNALRDDELTLLPHSFHPYHRWQLGWLSPGAVMEVSVGEGEDRTVEEVLRKDDLLLLRYDDRFGMTVHFRGVGTSDDGKRTEPAVFIDELDTMRTQPLWVVDEAVPLPNVAETSSSYFTAGESWIVEEATPERAVMVDVVSVSPEEAMVRVHLGPPPPPVGIFVDGFDSSDPSE